MELRHLRYFVAVAETLSFTRAAEKLHLAQPSLTRQIKDLEDEIGVRLLDRTKQRVNLTREGKSFLIDAKRVLELSGEMVEAVRRVSRRETTSLNIGYVADIFYDLLPMTLASFQRSFPTVAINLFDMTCGEQFDALQDNKIDLGFVGLREPIEQRGLLFQRVATYKTLAALQTGHRLCRKPIIKLKEFENEFFIGMSEESYPGYRDWLTDVCHRAGFRPKVLQDADIEKAVLQAVAAGLGIALVPNQVQKLPHKGVDFRKITPAVITESCIAWKSNNLSAALTAYVQVVKHYGTSMR